MAEGCTGSDSGPRACTLSCHLLQRLLGRPGTPTQQVAHLRPGSGVCPCCACSSCCPLCSYSPVSLRSRLYLMHETWVQSIPVTCLCSQEQASRSDPGSRSPECPVQHGGWGWQRSDGHGGLLVGRRSLWRSGTPAKPGAAADGGRWMQNYLLHFLITWDVLPREGTNGGTSFGPQGRAEGQAVGSQEIRLLFCLLLPAPPEGKIISCQSHHQITGNCCLLIIWC